MMLRKEREMDIKKLITMTPELWDQVQNWRFTHRVETSTEAVRQLIILGLTHSMTDSLKSLSDHAREDTHPFAA